ncbi:MAG: hypothetical protein QW320_06535 [Ignisphaera sp.]|uniref:hypothetical protein n=1 Tax=Thermofilum sp. TaxID=1961369 RepID=UPI003164BC20
MPHEGGRNSQMPISRFFTSSGMNHDSHSSLGEVSLRFRVDRVEEDEYGYGYKMLHLSYRGSVFGKLIVKPNGYYSAFVSTHYRLVPNEYVEELLKINGLRYNVYYEQWGERALFTVKLSDDFEVAVSNSIDASLALKAYVTRVNGYNVFIPVAYRKHTRNIKPEELVELLKELRADEYKAILARLGSEDFDAKLTEALEAVLPKKDLALFKYYLATSGKVSKLEAYSRLVRLVMSSASVSIVTKIERLRAINAVFAISELIREA